MVTNIKWFSSFAFGVCIGMLFIIAGLTYADNTTEQMPIDEKTLKIKDTKTTRWDAYFKRKLYDPPVGFVVEGLKFIHTNDAQGKIALDLGAGVGHETLELLRHGYQVIAVDSEENAFKYLQQRIDTDKFSTQLKTIVSEFEKLDFSQLPATDLVVASFSLPFVSEKDFDRVWNNVVNVIKPGGYIIVNFFDPSFSFFDQRFRSSMTFHSKDQAFNLFGHFKVLYFKEIQADSLKPGTRNHYYVFIAKKLSGEI